MEDFFFWIIQISCWKRSLLCPHAYTDTDIHLHILKAIIMTDVLSESKTKIPLLKKKKRTPFDLWKIFMGKDLTIV